MSHWMKWIVAACTVTLLAACGGNDDDEPAAQPRNIVQTAQSDARFSILVEAVVAADLAGTLSAPGPFTVFAPTNDAFVALLAELGVTKEQLLADVPLLTKVLTYHVVPARVLKAAGLAITDQRARRASIVATDVLASNGVIHIVDKVILPAP